MRVLPAIIALLAPAMIISLAMMSLESLRSHADDREVRNAGKVINGKVVQGGVVGLIEDKLDEHSPSVIILGNSLSNTDLSPGLLGQRLGLKPKKVQRFSVPNSIGAHWYAILKNRVYANNHRPKIVILFSDLQSALAVSPRSEASMQNLRVHLTAQEKVIDRKLGARSYWVERVRENRTRLREKSLQEARNTVVDLLFHRSLRPTDSRKTDRALEKVFADNKTDMQLHNNVIPTFAQGANWENIYEPEDLPTPRDSFLSEIARLVNSEGGTAVFIRPPMSPELPDGLGDLVLEASERKVPKIVERNNGHYLDMRSLDVNIHHFINLDHMNGEGAKYLTEVLAEQLLEWQLIPHKAKEATASFVSAHQTVDGQSLQPLKPLISFDDPPPSLRNSRRALKRGRGQLVYMPAKDLALFSDTTTLEHSPYYNRCSPVRVLENNRSIMPKHNVACEEALEHRRGRVCQNNDKLFFTNRDGTNPITNGRIYRLILDPERSCLGGTWLYPGDVATLKMPKSELGRMATATHFTVSASAIGKGGHGDLEIEVADNDRVLLRTSLPTKELVNAIDEEAKPKSSKHVRHLPLDEHGSLDENTTLIFRNESDRFILVRKAELSGPAIPKSQR